MKYLLTFFYFSEIARMRILGITIILVTFGLTCCEKEEDASDAFMEAAQALFSGANNDAIGGLQGVASAFMQSDAGKQVHKLNYLYKKSFLALINLSFFSS